MRNANEPHNLPNNIREVRKMVKNNENILCTKDLMNYLGIGKDRAYALMHLKSFPSIKIGKTYIVTVAELENWLSNNKGKEINL